MRRPRTTTLFPSTTLFRSNSTFNTMLINQGLLVPLGSDTFAGTFQNQAGATLVETAHAGALDADLTVANGFAQNDRNALGSSNGKIAPAMHVSAGELVNAG